MSAKTRFRGPGELEKTGYMPEGSSDEREVERAIEALQNLGADLNDYDSEALDIVLAYALEKLAEEPQEPYKWPNP